MQSENERKLKEKDETHQKELDTIVMNGKNDMNALVMKHEKELEATKREMILVKDLADRQRAEELAKREEEWDKTRKEVGEYGFI